MDSVEYEKLVGSISSKLTNIPELVKRSVLAVGRSNLWEGASGFKHQIDVSLKSEKDILLVECKYWNEPVDASVFLTLFGRIFDIKGNVTYKQNEVRGAIVSKKGWQSGVEELTNYYAAWCSLFRVDSEAEIVEMIHTHFIKPPGISSEEKVGTPRIIKS